MTAIIKPEKGHGSSSCVVGMLPHLFHRLLHKYGFIVGTYPLPFLLLPLALTLSLAYFAFQIPLGTTKVHVLYASSNAPSVEERRIYTDFTKSDYDEHYYEVAIRRADGQKMLTQHDFDHVIELFNSIHQNLSIVYDNQTFTLQKICSEKYAKCSLPNQALLYFSAGFFTEDLRNFPRVHFKYPMMDLAGVPIPLFYIMANVTLYENGTLNEAYQLRLLMLMDVGKSKLTGKKLETFDEKVLRELGRAMLRYVYGIEQSEYVYYANYWDAITDGALEVADRTAPLVIPSLLLLIVFAIVSCSLYADPARRMPLEAAAGVLNPIFAMLSAFAHIQLQKIYDWNAALIVIVFLVLAIGVDDMFVMLAHWRELNPSIDPATRLALLLEDVGASVVLTTIINILAFVFGLTQPVLIIQMFAGYASIALAYEYVYQMTFFLSILALEARRRRTKLLAATAASLGQNEINNSSSPISKLLIFLQSKLIKLKVFSKNSTVVQRLRTFTLSRMFKRSAYISVVIVAAIYLALSVYFVSRIDVTISPGKAVMDGSKIQKFYEQTFATSFKEAQRMQIVVNSPPNHKNASDVAHFLEMVHELETIPKYSLGNETTELWLKEYESTLALFNTNRSLSILITWVNLGTFGKWADDLHWTSTLFDPSLTAFRFRTYYHLTGGFEDLSIAMQMIRDILVRYPEFNATVYNTEGIFADQVSQLADSVMQDLGITILAICFSCCFLLPHMPTIFWVSFCVLTVEGGTIGCLEALTDASIDQVTWITITMAVGFSVDYLLHSAHAVRDDLVRNPASKKLASAKIAWPILQGGIATCCGICALVFVPAYIPRIFFANTVIVVVIGAATGLLFLPVVLSKLSLEHLLN